MKNSDSNGSLNLILHTPAGDSLLTEYYHRAFANATELFIVTAYLTEWDSNLELNHDCKHFRLIIGKDFGITKKKACEAVMKWLPSKRKSQFLVANQIDGFHPKAVFWKESNGQCFSIVGSSNLTRAAFETNYEANLYCLLSEEDYLTGKKWVKNIEKRSVPVCEDWLKDYKEASPTRWPALTRKKKQKPTPPAPVGFKLPRPPGMKNKLDERRDQLLTYRQNKQGLTRLFQRCANGEITSRQFYDDLQNYWSFETGDRLQGKGYEIKGKNSDFMLLSQSYLRILAASNEDRDDVVSEEIDMLKERRVPTRGAFLSEMLCLRFPDEYPVLNEPVKKYLKAVKFKAPLGSSEGVRYIHLAKVLRASLLQNEDHPATNLAELDTIIWQKYGRK